MAVHESARRSARIAELADAIAQRVTESVPGTVSYRDAIAAAAAIAIAESESGAASKSAAKSLDRD